MSALENFFQPSQVFEMGWENARRSRDQYWSPSTKDWPRCDASDVTRIALGSGLGEVKVDRVYDASSVWPLVKASWQIAKMNHPAAVWSPRDGAWYDHKGSGGGGSKPPLSPAAKALHQRLEEIKNMTDVDDNEKLQLRNRALRDYADQLAAPPP